MNADFRKGNPSKPYVSRDTKSFSEYKKAVRGLIIAVAHTTYAVAEQKPERNI